MITRSILEEHRYGIREVLEKFDTLKAEFKRPLDFEWERYFDGFDVLILEENPKSVLVELIKNESYTRYVS